ncbi:MAG: hypothetical protein EZS28_015681 [Streblomastix strix]|uniref:Uncharacterized protein n=1 Tax=Streblomastix strix TaxID=222440 RepID=A0A5J4W1V6_9EUKA|nr:MAG: hypothetical protein EZS28_015681 [Streblomastix strix]
MQYTIPPLVQHVSYEKRLKIIDTEEIDDDGVSIIKTLKLPILQNARLLSSLMIFDDIGSNTDIQSLTTQLFVQDCSYLMSCDSYRNRDIRQ